MTRDQIRAAFIRGFEMWVFFDTRPTNEREADGFDVAASLNERSGVRPCAGDAAAAWDRFVADFKPYWTLSVPSVPDAFRTVWHPTERGGSFDPLSRGAFKTEEEAIEWGRAKLAGTPYRIRHLDPLTEQEIP